MTARAKALVTAPLRGPGLERLREIADVVYDPWIEQRPLRILDGPKLADWLTAESADVLIVESDFVSGPVFDLGAAGHLLDPRRSQQRRRGRCDGQGHPGVQRAWPQCRRRRRTRRGAPVRVHALGRARRRRRAGGRGVPRRPHPLSAVQGMGAQRQDRRARGARRRRARRCSGGSRGSACAVIAFDPYNPEAKHSLDEVLAEADVISLHAPVTDETTGMIGAAQFAAMKDGVVFLNTRPRAPARSRRARGRAAVRQGRGGRPRPLQGREPAR